MGGNGVIPVLSAAGAVVERVAAVVAVAALAGEEAYCR
jgi:hypothetical protein